MCPRCCLPVPWEHNAAIQHGLGGRGVSWLRLITAPISVTITYAAPAIDVRTESGLFGEDGYYDYHRDAFECVGTRRLKGVAIYRLLGQSTGGYDLSSNPPINWPSGVDEYISPEVDVSGTVTTRTPDSINGGYVTEVYQLKARASMKVGVQVDWNNCTLNQIALTARGKPTMTSIEWLVDGEPSSGPFYSYDQGPENMDQLQDASSPIISGIVGGLDFGTLSRFQPGGRAFSKLVTAPTV